MEPSLDLDWTYGPGPRTEHPSLYLDPVDEAGGGGGGVGVGGHGAGAGVGGEEAPEVKAPRPSQADGRDGGAPRPLRNALCNTPILIFTIIITLFAILIHIGCQMDTNQDPVNQVCHTDLNKGDMKSEI